MWAPIPGYEGLYEVSSAGEVRSLDRVQQYATYTRTLKGKLLKPRANKKHYKVMLSDRNFQRKDLLVHRLVLLAFIGPAPQGTEACHRDDNGKNNNLDNLYWGTRSDNVRDQVKNTLHYNAGKDHCGRGHPYSGKNLMKNGKRRQCVICYTASQKKYKFGGTQEQYISELELRML